MYCDFCRENPCGCVRCDDCGERTGEDDLLDGICGDCGCLCKGCEDVYEGTMIHCGEDAAGVPLLLCTTCANYDATELIHQARGTEDRLEALALRLMALKIMRQVIDELKRVDNG